MKIYITKLPLCKMVAFLFYLYINWYKEVYGNNLILLYGLSCLLTLMVFGRMIYKKAVPKTFGTYIPMLLVFSLYSLVTGLIVSSDKSVLVSTVVTLVAFTIVCYDYYYICQECADYNWLLNVFIICATICAVQTIFAGSAYNNGVVVTTMSSNNNPNNLSVVLFIGMVAVAAKESFFERHLFFSIVLLSLQTYAIILSGSRKTAIICALFLLFLIVRYLSKNIHKMSQGDFRKKTVFAVFVIAVFIVMANRFSKTVLFLRLMNMFQEGTSNIRFALYQEAFEFWKSSPLFGIGLGQVKLNSQYHLYSHSSYAELLACSGIIGLLLFYFPFVKIIKKAILSIYRKDSDYTSSILGMALLCELLLGLGTIFIYSFTHLSFLLLFFLYFGEVSPKEGINTNDSNE